MNHSIAQSLVVASAETTPHSFTSEQIEIIKNSVAKGVSDQELAYFLEVCRSTGLNPLHRQIYAIVRSGSMTIQTGIDGYRLLAHRSKRHVGTDDAVYDTEEAAHPNKATVTVYKWVSGQRCAYTATARWSEYAQEKSPMWGKMPFLMLAKCAEALALRKAFPAETSGIYTDEEMQQADEPMVAIAAPVTVTEQKPDHSAEVSKKIKQPFMGFPASGSSMAVSDFCRKVRDHLTLTPKMAMAALGVKSLTGIDLDEAYKTLVRDLRRGEESQELPAVEEIAAGISLERLHIKANRLGYSMAQWDQLKDDCHNDLGTIEYALNNVEQNDLRQVTHSAAGVH